MARQNCSLEPSVLCHLDLGERARDVPHLFLVLHLPRELGRRPDLHVLQVEAALALEVGGEGRVEEGVGGKLVGAAVAGVEADDADLGTLGDEDLVQVEGEHDLGDLGVAVVALRGVEVSGI